MAIFLDDAREVARLKYKEIFTKLYIYMHEGSASNGWITIGKLEQLRLPMKYCHHLIAELGEIDDNEICVRKGGDKKTDYFKNFNWIENKFVLTSFEKWIENGMI